MLEDAAAIRKVVIACGCILRLDSATFSEIQST